MELHFGEVILALGQLASHHLHEVFGVGGLHLHPIVQTLLHQLAPLEDQFLVQVESGVEHAVALAESLYFVLVEPVAHAQLGVLLVSACDNVSQL